LRHREAVIEFRHDLATGAASATSEALPIPIRRKGRFMALRLYQLMLLLVSQVLRVA
jgi:hypothetical protein